MQPTPRELVNAYEQMVEDRLVKDWKPTFLTFMFKPLGGTVSYKRKIMESTVESIYEKMLTRYHRRPRSVAAESLPLWLLCPDWPVPKTRKFDRDHLLNIVLNDGLHYHGLALTPVTARCQQSFMPVIYEMQEVFCRRDGPIHHFVADDVTETPEVALGYILKSVTRRRVDSSDVLIFPKNRSELQTRNLRVTPRMEVERRLNALSPQTGMPAPASVLDK